MAPPAPLAATAAEVRNKYFAVRFVTADDQVHEVECRDGAVVAWRRERSDVSAPILELFVPRVLDHPAGNVLPFVEDARLHNDVLVSSPRSADVHRLFPLSVAGRNEAKELLPDFRALWVFRDGPFGDFAWRNSFVDGRCEMNDAVPVRETENSPWDVIVEGDFVDGISFFLGDIEFREILERAPVQGAVAALSTLTWFAERDEMIDRTKIHRDEAELMRDWVTIARSDSVVAWAAALRRNGMEPLAE